MWPLEGRGGREWVRVGALAVERWRQAGRGLTLAGSHALPVGATMAPGCLSAAIAALYPAPPARKPGLVLESAWLPLLLADTGGTLWSWAQVDLLLRHQMEAVYGDGTQAVAGWTLRTEHRIGARHALGYGLAPAVKQALVEAGKAAGITWDALLPAWAWGRDRLQLARRPLKGTAWCWWPEQDRGLLACLQNGEVVALNTAVTLCTDTATVERAVAAESVRQGRGPGQHPVTAASWLPTPRLSPSRSLLAWVSITGRGAPAVSLPGGITEGPA